MTTENITNYHAKYFAYELTRQRRGGDVDRLATSLFDASVDLNPHQIDAALFALQNPLSKGVLLADEVGLGKTIEAALVICQYWAERRRRLIVIAPAALRKQWANELSEKFHLPTQVLDARTYKQQRDQGIYDPLDQDVISVMSYHLLPNWSPSCAPYRGISSSLTKLTNCAMPTVKVIAPDRLLSERLQVAVSCYSRRPRFKIH